MSLLLRSVLLLCLVVGVSGACGTSERPPQDDADVTRDAGDARDAIDDDADLDTPDAADVPADTPDTADVSVDDSGGLDTADVPPTPVREPGIGMVGQCTAEDDLEHLDALQPSEIHAHPCASTCTEVPDDGCFERCLDFEAISSPCRSCVGVMLDCTQQHCADACTSGWSSSAPACVSCRVERCGVEFSVCAGSTTAIPEPVVPVPEPLTCRDFGGVSDVEAMVREVNEQCWPSCRTGAAAGECVAGCLVGSEFRPACADCVSEYMACNELCGTACTDGPFSYQCAACLPECVSRAEVCLADGVWELIPVERYGEIRLVNVLSTVPFAAMTRLPDGAPLARIVAFGRASAYGQIEEGPQEIAVTDGPIGPSAVPLATASIQVVPFRTSTIVAYPTTDGPQLHAQLAPSFPSGPVSVTVLNAIAADEVWSVQINEGPSTPLPYGFFSAAVALEPSFDVTLIPDVGPSWTAAVDVEAGSIVTVAVIANEALDSGLEVLVIPSPGNVQSKAPIRVAE